MTAPSGVLAGATVVVTRATEQSSALVEQLQRAGAGVVQVPLITIVDEPDGLASLRRALHGDLPLDGIIVTSPNGARRLARAWSPTPTPPPPVYVVGPGTAAALDQAGGPTVTGVAGDHLAEGVLALLGSGTGHLVVAQGDLARPTLTDGLRAAGWQVTALTVYRTVTTTPDPSLVSSALAADVVTLASGSAARAWAEVCDGRRSPPVVAMGPVTADVARHCGLAVVDVADPHTVEGLAAATIRAVTTHRRGVPRSGS